MRNSKYTVDRQKVWFSRFDPENSLIVRVSRNPVNKWNDLIVLFKCPSCGDCEGKSVNLRNFHVRTAERLILIKCDRCLYKRDLSEDSDSDSSEASF